MKLILKAYKNTNKIFLIDFFLYIKMTNNYYQKQKEKRWKEVCGRYQSLSEEEKNKKRKRTQGRYQNFTEEEKKKRRSKNLSEEQKQKLV